MNLKLTDKITSNALALRKMADILLADVERLSPQSAQPPVSARMKRLEQKAELKSRLLLGKRK